MADHNFFCKGCGLNNAVLRRNAQGQNMCPTCLASGQQAEPINEQAAHDEWWDSKNMSSEFSLMTMNQSRAAWWERARRAAALAGHQSERPAPAGQAVGEPTREEVLQVAQEVGLIDWISNDGAYFSFADIRQASALLVAFAKRFAASQAERPAVKEDKA